MKDLFRNRRQTRAARMTAAALILAGMLALTACLPETTGTLFSATPASETVETATSQATPALSPTASQTPSSDPTTPQSSTPVATVTPEITATPTPTEIPSPTPTPAPPRFSFAEDFKALWGGAPTIPYALVKTTNKLDKYEYLEKLLGMGYQKSDVPPMLFSEAYDNGNRFMTIHQTSFTYQDKNLLDNQQPITTVFRSEADIVSFATAALSGLFPAEMLKNGVVTGFKSRNGSLYSVTVKYPQSVGGGIIDDVMEGVDATIGASGILEMHFQWCDYVADMDMLLDDISFVLTELNRLQPNGDPVKLVSATLVYKPNDMGVRYIPAWQCLGDDGERYYVFLY